MAYHNEFLTIAQLFDIKKTWNVKCVNEGVDSFDVGIAALFFSSKNFQVWIKQMFNPFFPGNIVKAVWW